MEQAQPISNDQSRFLKALHDECVVMLDGLTFDQRPERDGLLVGMYGSLIELTGGFLVLVNFDRYAAISSVSRAFLETYVDFKNLFDDPTYIKHIYANHHAQGSKLRKSSQDNPYLSDVRAHTDFESSLRHHETELAKLKGQNFHKLSAKERFVRAGMLHEYEAIYHLESDGAHSSLGAFISRHVEFGEDDFNLALYKKRSANAYNSRLELHTAYLLDATEKLHGRLKSEHLERIGKLKEQWEKLRATFTP